MKTNCQKCFYWPAGTACISKITNTTDRTVNHEGSKVKVTSFATKCRALSSRLQIASKCLDVFEFGAENWWAVSTNHTGWELPTIVTHACLNSKQKRTERKQTSRLHNEISLSASGSLFSFLPLFFFSSASPLLCLLVAPSECRAFLFVCSCGTLPADPPFDFPKADINITGHCDGVIFMEAQRKSRDRD